ncbi:MAG TPA: ATP-binding protein [Acidimicrobiales bacterium]|jgi:anti-sigma regulatory factor (Ser/Thr protein kinase)
MVALSRCLEAEPAAVREARGVVRISLERSDEDLIALVVLLADEVVTNAVLHGEGPIDLAVETNEDRVKVTVRDRSDARPVPGEPAHHAEDGRGLSIVEALASRWGVSAMEPGKSVWFEIDRAS